MLQFINDLPGHVVGIRATGEVSKEDYQKVLIPRIEELIENGSHVNYLVVLETDLHKFSAAAWWEDFKFGFKNFGKWEKVAVVTDQKSVEWFSDVVGHIVPGQVRGFKLSELSEALKWVSETDIGHHEPESISIDKLQEDLQSRSSNIGQGPAVEDL
jgi:hypothetical protein